MAKTRILVANVAAAEEDSEAGRIFKTVAVDMWKRSFGPAMQPDTVRKDASLIKMMILAPRRAGMTHAEFRRYVTEVHGPLVKSVTEVAADIRHYHYNFPIPGADRRRLRPSAGESPGHRHRGLVRQRGGPEAEHEVAQATWRSSGPTSTASRTANARSCTTRGRSRCSAGSARSIRVFYFRRRRPGLSRVEFQERWLAGCHAGLRSRGSAPGRSGRLRSEPRGERGRPSRRRRRQVLRRHRRAVPRGLGRLAVLGDHQASLAAMRRLEQELLDPRGFIAETFQHR